MSQKKIYIQHKQEVNRDFNRCAIIYLLSQAIFLETAKEKFMKARILCPQRKACGVGGDVSRSEVSYDLRRYK